MWTYTCACTYLHAQVCAQVPHHPSPYPSQLSFWDRANLWYGGVGIPGAYARGRMPLLLPCADPEQGKKALYNKGQPKPPGKDAVVMLTPWGTRMSQFVWLRPSAKTKKDPNDLEIQDKFGKLGFVTLGFESPGHRPRWADWEWLICKASAGWLRVLSATKASLNPRPAVYLLDKDVHTYLMVDGSLFPPWSN